MDRSTCVVYSLGTINTNHVCAKAKIISQVQIKSGQALKINPGCYIWTSDHVITAGETEDVEVHSKWLNWTWTLGERFQLPKNKIVMSMIQRLRIQISSKFDADELLQELTHLKDATNPGPLNVHLPRGHDCGCDDPIPDWTLLLEEVLPKHQLQSNPGQFGFLGTSSTNGVQHELRSDLKKMKFGKKTIPF
jgi:hypothetical protein